MRRVLLFVSLICVAFLLYSNNIVQDFIIYNNWGIGWSVDYEIYTLESRIVANDTSYTSAVTQKVTIELNDTTADGDLVFVCRPSVKNRIVDKTGMSERYKELVEKVDTIPVELLTDRYGVVKNIRNLAEIQNQLKNSGLYDVVVAVQLEKYKEEHKNATSQELKRMEDALSQMKEQMYSESVVYKSVEEIISLFMHNGRVFAPGKEYLENVKKPIVVAPNLNLDVVLRTKAEKYDIEDGSEHSFVKISRVSKFDANQLTPVFESMIKSLYRGIGESVISEYLKSGEVDERWLHIIDAEVGVCLHSLYDFSFTVGDCTIKKEIEIRFP